MDMCWGDDDYEATKQYDDIDVDDDEDDDDDDDDDYYSCLLFAGHVDYVEYVDYKHWLKLTINQPV